MAPGYYILNNIAQGGGGGMKAEQLCRLVLPGVRTGLGCRGSSGLLLLGHWAHNGRLMGS